MLGNDWVSAPPVSLTESAAYSSHVHFPRFFHKRPGPLPIRVWSLSLQNVPLGPIYSVFSISEGNFPLPLLCQVLKEFGLKTEWLCVPASRFKCRFHRLPGDIPLNWNVWTQSDDAADSWENLSVFVISRNYSD